MHEGLVGVRILASETSSVSRACERGQGASLGNSGLPIAQKRIRAKRRAAEATR